MTIDFLAVSTATFPILFVLIVLAHDRRRIVHFDAFGFSTQNDPVRQAYQAPAFQRPSAGVLAKDSLSGWDGI
jgi:hypothetical protein